MKTMMFQAFGPNVMRLVVLLAAVGGGEATLAEISCIDGSNNYLEVKAGSVQCDAVAAALNTFEGVTGMKCDSTEWLRFGSSAECQAPKNALETFSDIDLDCVNGYLWTATDGARCERSVAALNKLLACIDSSSGTLQTDGGCECPANTYAAGMLVDGTTADNGLRIFCKECPLNSLTRVPLVVGASTLHQCVAKCPSGQRSLDGSCVECDVNTFADGTDENNYNDEGYRISCKPCPWGEISEAGAASCFAKYQKVPNQLFCYGSGTDSLSKKASINADEFVFALSRAGAVTELDDQWKSCEEAQNRTPSLANAAFIKPDDLACSYASATLAECEAAFEKAEALGMSEFMFCNHTTQFGEEIGPLCRQYMCKGADPGPCWHPDFRGTTPYPLGCILNTDDDTVMYYSDEDAKRYYNGFAYQPICERKVCPADSDGSFRKPVPLGEDDFKTDADRKKVPECQLSERGLLAKNKAASDKNNTVFIPIALSLTVICMIMAAVITQDDLKWQWIIFGVGMRTFDM
jgi:hypothetical protein